MQYSSIWRILKTYTGSSVTNETEPCKISIKKLKGLDGKHNFLIQALKANYVGNVLALEKYYKQIAGRCNIWYLRYMYKRWAFKIEYLNFFVNYRNEKLLL